MKTTRELLTNQLYCDDFIALFGDHYPLLKEFKATPQDPEWHAEGDVHIHTDMVLSEVYRLIREDASHLLDNEKIILIFAALFHDYAKPISTKVKEIAGKERIVAPKHEGVGASLLFNLDPPLDMSPQDWLSVIQLTAYHHIPKLLVLKSKGQPDYYRLARQVISLEMLHWLEWADMTGRTCADKKDQLDILTMFRLDAQEYGVWNSDGYEGLHEMVSQHFPDEPNGFHQRVVEHAKIHLEEGRIHMLEEELSIAYNYISQPRLIVTCGMAGTGKSTWIDKHIKGHYRIELDAIRDEVSKGRANQDNDNEVVRIAHDHLKQALREKKHIIWDATNYRADFRKRIIDMGVAYGAYTEIIAFQKPLSRLLHDNKQRKHAVPDDAIQAMLKKFQWPEIGEAHALRIIHQ